MEHLEEQFLEIDNIKQTFYDTIKKKTQEVEAEFVVFINNESIDLDERFNLWLKAPNDIKKTINFVNCPHDIPKALEKWIAYMIKLCPDIFSNKINMTEMAQDCINDMQKESDQILIKQFLLKHNAGLLRDWTGK